MFAVFPNTHPATLFGINKGAAVLGTAAATVQYARRVDMPWRALLPAAAVPIAAGCTPGTKLVPAPFGHSTLRKPPPASPRLPAAMALSWPKRQFAGASV